MTNGNGTHLQFYKWVSGILGLCLGSLVIYGLFAINSLQVKQAQQEERILNAMAIIAGNKITLERQSAALYRIELNQERIAIALGIKMIENHVPGIPGLP